MARIVKVGIIGCGGIANQKHMPSLSKIENVRMVAFCDLIPERAQAAKEKFGTLDAFVCTDYRELLAIKDIEVVHVLTPNREHSEITVAALKAGKHVMCKNPGFIGIDDILNRYLPNGFSHFKIEGRSLGSAVILEFLLYYMTKPECQLKVREEIYLDSSLDLF